MSTHKPLATILYSPLTWLAVFVIAAALYISTFFADCPRASQAVLINYAFFAPIATGMVAWPAIIFLSRGRWLGGIERYAWKGIAFLPVSIIGLLILWFLRDSWAPWPALARAHPVWLSSYFIFARFAVSLLILWILAWYFVRTWHTPSKPLGTWMIVVYCIAFSFFAFDFIMALDPKWYSSLLGGYFFISGLYGAAVAWTLLYILVGRQSDEIKLDDLSGIILAFSILTTYMGFAQLIVLWYENLPDEVRYLIPRYNLPSWKLVSLFLICTVYLGPLVLLLTRWCRTNRIYIACVCVLLLISLWIERWWLITPTASPGRFPLGWTEIVSAASFLSLFILCCTLTRFFNSEENHGPQ